MLQVGNRLGPRLDGHHPAGVGAHRHREEASAAVGVEQHIVDGWRQRLVHQANERVGTGGVHLEEGRPCDSESSTGDDLVDVIRSDHPGQTTVVALNHRYVPVVRLRRNLSVDHRQPLARPRPGSDDDALDPVQRTQSGVPLGQVWHQELAGLDGNQRVGSLAELRRPPIDYVERHLVAIAERRARSDRVTNRRVGDPAQVPELAGHHGPLHHQLGGVVGVLPLASSALREVGTARRDPAGVGLDHLEEVRLGERTAIDDIGDGDDLVRERSGHEIGLAIVPADRVAAVGHVVGAERRLHRRPMSTPVSSAWR